MKPKLSRRNSGYVNPFVFSMVHPRKMFVPKVTKPLLVFPRWSVGVDYGGIFPNQIKPGITNEEMVQNLDFAQTFLEAAMIQVPDDMQGESLVPLLKGSADQWDREAVYYHYYEYPSVHMAKRHYGIVNKEFKLVHFYYDIDEWELYDRINDPSEMNNVYNDPNYKDVVVKLRMELKEMRIKYKDSEELDKNFIYN